MIHSTDFGMRRNLRAANAVQDRDSAILGRK